MKTKKKINSLFLILIILVSFQSSLNNFEFNPGEKEEEKSELSTPQASLTTNLYPNQNINTNTFQSNYYSRLSSADGVACYTSGQLLEVGFANTPSNAVTITEVHFYVYAKELASGCSIYMAPRIGSLFSEDYNPLNTYYTTEAEDWFGSWTKAQIDAMSFRIRSSGQATGDRVYVDRVYCTITYTVPTPPATPSTPTASETTCYDGTSRLSWTYPSGATRMYIYEATTSGGTYVYQTYKTPTTTYYDITKTSAQTRYYKLRAWNADGYSGYSGYRAITWSVPSVPTSISYSSPNYDGDPTFTWTNPSSQSVDQNLMYWDSDINRGSYDYLYSTGADTSMKLSDPGSCGTNHRPPLPVGTYYIWVRAHNPVGWSGYSTIYTFTISNPVIPTMITGSQTIYDDEINIEWDDTITGANQVNLQISTTSESEGFSDISGATSSPTSQTGLSLGNYYYRVRASQTDTGGVSYSSPITIVVSSPGDPGSPTCSSPDFDGDLEISWSSGTGSTSAILQISTDGSNFDDIPGETSSPTTLLNKNEGSYWFRVKSTNI